MSKNRVLVVEDEHDIASLIKDALERNGDADAEVVETGEAALDAVAARLPDLIILDLNLPMLDGREVCRILRARFDSQDLPIIILTARTSENDRVSGLEHGADDYVTKPFSLRELTARVRAVLRRRTLQRQRSTAAYTGPHLIADFDAVAVAVDGEAIRLTRREFELLRYLVQNRSRVVLRNRLLERVWGFETRSVDVHIRRLRSKLKTAGRQIETIVGLGYRFNE